MFCQECGTQNPDGSIFCQKCGAKLDVPNVSKKAETQYVQPNYVQPQVGYMQPQGTPAAPGKPMSKKTKVLLGLIVLLCIAIFGSYNFAKSQFSPQNAAQKYFLNVMNGKWGKVYDQFDIKESKFITKKNFLKSQKDVEVVKYNTYKVGKAQYDKDSLGTEIMITYRLKGDAEDSTFEVYLNKQKEKNLFFFDSWKINPSDYIQENFEVQVPKDTEVKFDGTKLNDSFVKDSDDTFTYYEIPEIFKGEYPISVSQANMETVDTKVSTEDSGYYLDNMTLSEQAKSDIIAAAQNALQAFYTAGLAKKDFSEVADNFSEDQTVRDDAQTQYTDFMNGLMSDSGEGITKIDLHDFTGDTSSSVEDGILTVNVDLNYNYDVNYTQSDWWSGDLTKSSYSGSDNESFTYIFENGKWVIQSADYNKVYY